MANITKRGDTYRIKVSCGYDVNGKQVIKSMTYKPDPTKSDKWNEKEVNRQAVLFEESCKKGQTSTSMKFEVFAREWFKDYAELKLKRNTVSNYHQMEKRAYVALGHIRVDKITPLDIQHFVRSLVADGLSAETVKSHVRFVSTVLSYAVKKRVLTYNPCTAVDYPIAQEKERDFYSVEEVKRLLELLRNDDEDKNNANNAHSDNGWNNVKNEGKDGSDSDNSSNSNSVNGHKDKHNHEEHHNTEHHNKNKPFLVFFTLAAYMGARKGELLGLEWKDIDFNNDTITISRAYYYDAHKREYFTDTPKTKQSRRTLKMPAHVMDTLKDFKTWQDHQREIWGGSWVDTDRLFTQPNGEPMNTNKPYNYLREFCKREGMRMCNVHSFRHFNASALINSGVDVVTVQTALGHSTPSTTLNFYSHNFSNAQTRAMVAIANAIDL